MTETALGEYIADYEGRILAVREENGYDDSYWSALIEQSPGLYVWIGTGSTAFAGGWIGTPNATPEVRARYAEWYAAQQAKVAAAKALAAESAIGVGSEVKIVAGRKHKGKSGIVTWYGECKYTSSANVTAHRVKVQEPSGTEFWCPADYCAVETSSGWVPCSNARTYRGIPMGAAAEESLLARYPAPSQIPA